MRREIVFATLTLIVGVVTGRLLHLSEFLSVSLGIVPASLVIFPAVKSWTEKKLTFKKWVLAIGIGLVSTWLIYLAMRMR